MHSLRERRGYTLIEILLVLGIIAIVTAVTFPNFVNSMRGNRLRAAARMVVTCGKHSRSMAVLKQEEMMVTFDLDSMKVSMSSLGKGKTITRQLDQVEFDYVQVEGEGKHVDGKCTVMFHSNGRCAPYKVRISDKRGDSIVVEVDALCSMEVYSDK